jgi:iron-sulfur cluster repair protein YtfE (RIC family)
MDATMLDQLEEQHRLAEQLLTKLENAQEETEQRSLVDELTTALTEHMQLEESQVYPMLRELDDEMGEEAEVEHGLARKGLEQLVALVGQPGFGAAVAMVKAGIAHHVEEEENEAFPKLRESLGGGSSGSASGAPGGGATKEELYEKAKEMGIEGRSSMSKEELAEAVGE